MSWTRGLLALLAVCVLLVTGSVSCGTHGAQEHKDGRSVSPVGKVLDDTDHEGRHYREVDKENAPDVGIEVQPDTDDSWSVRLTVENFTFSPAATKAKAVSGRGVAVLFVDDRPVTTLRTPSCRLPSAYVPQGTHKVTARLYADDGTVWAVDGTPVESTADVTASEPESAGDGGSGPRSLGADEASEAGAVDAAPDGRPSASTGGSGVSYPRVAGAGGVGRGAGALLATGLRVGSEARAGAAAAGGAPDVQAGGSGVSYPRVAGAGGVGRGAGALLATGLRVGSEARAVAGAAGGAPDVQAVAGTAGGVPGPQADTGADGRAAGLPLTTGTGSGVVPDVQAVVSGGRLGLQGGPRAAALEASLRGSQAGIRLAAAGPSLTMGTGPGVVPGGQAVAGGGLPGLQGGPRTVALEVSLRGSQAGTRTAAAEPSLMMGTGPGVVPGGQAVAAGGFPGSQAGTRTAAAEPSLSGSQAGTRTAAAEPSLTASTGSGTGTSPGTRTGGGR